MNIKPARRRVTTPPPANFDLWNGDPFAADEHELRLIDRIIAFLIILAVCLCLLVLATCTPAHAADCWDRYSCDQERQREESRRDTDRWSAETSRRVQESVRDLEAGFERQRAEARHRELIDSIDANTIATRRRRY